MRSTDRAVKAKRGVKTKLLTFTLGFTRLPAWCCWHVQRHHSAAASGGQDGHPLGPHVFMWAPCWAHDALGQPLSHAGEAMTICRIRRSQRHGPDELHDELLVQSSVASLRSGSELRDGRIKKRAGESGLRSRYLPYAERAIYQLI